MTRITDTVILPHAQPNSAIEQRHADPRVDHEVRSRIEACSYRFVFDRITWQYKDGKLELHGQLPSFYLKQLLQELLRNIEGVQSLVNHVDVVSSNGLSSERPNVPR